MPLSDAEACSVVRSVMSYHRKKIARCSKIPLNEFFNACYIAARTARDPPHARIAVRFTLMSLAYEDSHPNSRSSRMSDEQRQGVRELRIRSLPLDDEMALKIDLSKAFSFLQPSELVLIQLRLVQGLTQKVTAEMLNITIDQEQYRERKLLDRLRASLKDWF